jgi:Uma2 family endonuclease
MVWVIDPESRTLTVHRPERSPVELTEGQDLTGEDVLPEFRCRVADLFFMPGEQPRAAPTA